MSDYTFYLRFKNDNYEMQIEEPFLFNAFSHSMERKNNKFAVDVCLFAENTSLYFTDSAYSKTEEFEDIDGTVMFNLTHGLKRIIDSYNEYGPDGEIELKVLYLGDILTVCDFDLEDIETDLVSFFKCGFIENNIRSKHKIREDDIIIDMYADKDLDDNPITKLVPKKVLLKSKSTFANSKWVQADIPYTNSGAPDNKTNKIPAGADYQYFNFSKGVVEDGIEDTLVPSPLKYSNTFIETQDGTMKMIDCKTAKKETKLIIRSDVKYFHVQNGRTGFANVSSLELRVVVTYGTGIGDNYSFTLFTQTFSGTTPQSITVPPVIEFDFPQTLNEGEFVTVYWHFSWDSGTVALSIDYDQIDLYTRVVFNDCVMEMTTVETSINSVVQGTLWIDSLKQSAKIISGLEVDAPRIDVGGEYYKTLIANGGGIRNISNIPFNIKAKDLFEMGEMLAQDYQITEDKILVGEYVDFFSETKLGTFDIKPDEKFQWNTNKDYRVKTFDYAFKNYEQDRQEQRTLDAVHTQEQILFPNKKPIGTKKIEIPQIVDAYKIDSLRRLGIDPETKDSSLTDDTDLVMLKIIEIEPDHWEDYIGMMTISVVSGGIKIYTENFRWDKIGVGLTSQFRVQGGNNGGTYRVLAIETSVITLERLIGFGQKSETALTNIVYTLEDVAYKSETDELFEIVTGVLSKDTYTNMFYSKGRNILKWLPYLATCAMRYPNSELKVSFLKSNQDLQSKLYTDTSILVEKDPIPLSRIAESKVVTDREFTVTVYLEQPTDIIGIFNSMNIRNPDGSIGGYFEFLDNKGNKVNGYPKKLDFIPVENKVEATCLEKYIPFNGVVNLIDSEKSLYSQYAAFNGVYITLYYANDALFVLEKRFTKIRINGVTYTDLSLFLNDLEIYLS